MNHTIGTPPPPDRRKSASEWSLLADTAIENRDQWVSADMGAKPPSAVGNYILMAAARRLGVEVAVRQGVVYVRVPSSTN